MKRVLLVLFFLFGAGISALHAQIVLDPPFHSFGTIRPGKLYMVNVKLTNTGDKEVYVGGLRADCSCTKAKFPKTILKPHTSTTLMIHYQPPAEEKGWKTYELHFKSYQQGDDQKVHSKKEVFRYTAQLEPVFSLEPKVIDAGYAVYGNAMVGKGTLSVDPKAYPNWKPGIVQTDREEFSATLKELSKKGDYEIEVAFPKTLAVGHYVGNIQIAGKGPKDEIFTYPFKGLVGSTWNAAPATLLVPNLKTPQAYNGWNKSVLVRTFFSKPFKVNRVDHLPDWLKCDISHENIGYILKFHLDEGKLKDWDGSQLPSLEAVTDFKEEPNIEIPLIVQALPAAAKPTPTPSKPAPTLTPIAKTK